MSPQTCNNLFVPARSLLLLHCNSQDHVSFFSLLDPWHVCYSFCNPCSHPKRGVFEFEGWKHVWLIKYEKLTRHHIRIGYLYINSVASFLHSLREIQSHQLPQQVWGGICGPKVWARREIVPKAGWALKSWCCSKILWNFAIMVFLFHLEFLGVQFNLQFYHHEFCRFCKYVKYLNLN